LSPFQLDGTIVAPLNHKGFTSGLLQWIEFTKLRGIKIQGQGIIEGRGNYWWNIVSDLDSDDDPVNNLLPIFLSYFTLEKLHLKLSVLHMNISIFETLIKNVLKEMQSSINFNTPQSSCRILLEVWHKSGQR
jgi:hypothetical protein